LGRAASSGGKDVIDSIIIASSEIDVKYMLMSKGFCPMWKLMLQNEKFGGKGVVFVAKGCYTLNITLHFGGGEK